MDNNPNLGASCLGWIIKNKIKNEKGLPMEFDDRYFLLEPMANWFPKQVCMKSAQVGWSTLSIIKTLYALRARKFNCIYTLPTFDDVRDFVPAKVDGIIKNNTALSKLLSGADAVQRKELDGSFIWYRGTHSKKAAIMHSSDLNVYDELDASDLTVVDMYSSRLQNSKYKGEWKFSNPIRPGGVDAAYARSDMRRWIITCSRCNHRQHLVFEQNICKEREIYICARCDQLLSEDDRQSGEWIPENPSRSNRLQGYHVNQLMAPWVSARDILFLEEDKGAETFHTMVLGLPYIDKTEAVTAPMITGNIRMGEPHLHGVAMGVDVKYKVKHWVLMNHQGIFKVGTAKGPDGWKEIEKIMLQYNAKCLIDSAPDFYPRRVLLKKYPGRVFVAFYRKEKYKREPVRWGEKKEKGHVYISRHHGLQDVVNDFIEGKLKILSGLRSPTDYARTDLDEFITHWTNIYKRTEVDNEGLQFSVWDNRGPDDFAHATLYARVMLEKVRKPSFVEMNGGIDITHFQNNPGALSFEIFGDKMPGEGIPLFEAERGSDSWLYT